MDKYVQPMDKLGLIVEMATVEKERLVREEGVGVDVPMNLFGWSGDKLAIAIQVSNQLAQAPREDRFQVMGASAFILRRGFGVDSVTVVGEGFGQVQGSQPGAYAERYAQGDPEVFECLWITHQDRGDSQTLMCSLPYRYQLRAVEWGERRLTVEPPTGALPVLLAQALSVEAPSRSNRATRRELVDKLEDWGFFVQTF